MMWLRRGRSPAWPGNTARLRGLLLAVLATVTLVICGFALAGNRSPFGSGETDALPLRAASPNGSGADQVTSLWFGDSIVQGCCRSVASSLNMAQTAATTLGWQEPQVQGFPGTGYLTTSKLKGVTEPAYGDNIGQYLAGAQYRVVIVAGGNNDAHGKFSPKAFRTAVRATLQQVKRAMPAAKLVVLGPYSPNGTGYAAQRTIEREEAAKVGAIFIDGIAQGWFKDQQRLIHKDGFSPNDAGQAYLGVRMAVELKRLAL